MFRIYYIRMYNSRSPEGPRQALSHDSFLESYTQQMKDQEECPSQYSEDGTDNYSNYVDRYVVCENQVRQKQEDYSKNRVYDEYRHVLPSLSLSARLPRTQLLDFILDEKEPAPRGAQPSAYNCRHSYLVSRSILHKTLAA